MSLKTRLAVISWCVHLCVVCACSIVHAFVYICTCIHVVVVTY